MTGPDFGPDEHVPGDPVDPELERLLQAALSARARQIDERDLRPASPPVLPDDQLATRRAGRAATRQAATRRAGRRLPSLAVAAAAAGLLALATAVVWPRGGPGSPPIAGPSPVPSASSAPMPPGPVLAPPPSGSGTPPPVQATPPPNLGSPPPVPTAPTPTPDVLRVTPDPSGGRPATLTLTPRTEPASATAGEVTYPVVTVQGGDPAVTRRWIAAVNAEVDARRQALRARSPSKPGAGILPGQVIQVRGLDQWGHTLSIVLRDLVDDGGAVATATTVSVVLDKRTGQRLAAADLFTDVPAADALMRTALQASLGQGGPASPAVQRLSMRPQPGTAPAPAWFPSAQGLVWRVDSRVVTDDLDVEPEATVGWDRLTGLLTDQARP